MDDRIIQQLIWASPVDPMKITSCSKKFNYTFPRTVNSTKNSYTCNIEKTIERLSKRLPCTEKVVIEFCKNFPNLDYIRQAPILVCGDRKTEKIYNNLYNKTPYFEGKENKECQQVFYVDFFFPGKLVILEVGTPKYHSKEDDDLRFSTIKEIIPGVTIFSVYDYNNTSQYKKDILNTLTKINQMPDKEEEYLNYFDKTNWIEKYNNSIKAAKLLHKQKDFLEWLDKNCPDDTVNHKKTIETIETLKTLIS